MDHPALLIFVQVTIFTLMLAVGLNHSRREFLSLWLQRGLLVRSLVAVIVLVPAMIVLLLYVFDLPLGVATGLALLATAAGAPLTTKRAEMAGGDSNYVASLQLTLALLSVAVTPLTLKLFHELFVLDGEAVGVVDVAGQVAKVQFLPVVLGLALQHFVPKFAQRIGKPVALLANVLFLLLVLLALVPGIKMTFALGGLPILAIAIMVSGSLAIGHLLGGPAREHRAGLALASIARNIGLALFIATLANVEGGAMPTLLAYMILGALIALPYSIWNKRRLRGKPTSGAR